MGLKLSCTLFIFFLLVLEFLAFAKGKNESHNLYSSNVLISGTIVVSQDGSGNFSNINQAVAAAPNNSDARNGYFLIYIKEGKYEEYVSIPESKTYLMMVGQGINRTIITGNRSHGDGWQTYESQTFVVAATGFVAVNITFQNTAGPKKMQAVALRNEANLSTFYRCSFEGYQDTLCVDSKKQFYRECDVYGTIDFIFGNAQVVLQNCNIYLRLPLDGQFNVIAAQGRTSPINDTAISIQNCNIRPADDLASRPIGSVKTYLGRPWQEYSKTIVMQSFLDSLIDPAGWSVWNDTGFALSTLYFAEYDNKGPGANTSSRVRWAGYHIINDIDAAKFTVANFLKGNDWLPQTGVSYIPGLIT
ncbi:probable pectinesterase/pectinesterase inhibitor 7 [Lotus japonicus]|uniref:probable pectinesterase/pectinesterase inhibitor 7 n=1 Tax=Lotus japonicus TaxID=34305 RepID=UPI0025883ED9|nr:probable pectinesterase/pectinesterase inhibitor 7 [Lotus japonicus]